MAEYPEAGRYGRGSSSLPVRIEVEALAKTVAEGGWRYESLMKELEDDSRYGESSEVRREALLKLKTIGLLKSGKIGKRAVEANPTVLIDADGDAYTESEKSGRAYPVRGEYLEDIKHYDGIPTAPPISPRNQTLEAARRKAAENPRERLKEIYDSNVHDEDAKPEGGILRPLAPDHHFGPTSDG